MQRKVSPTTEKRRLKKVMEQLKHKVADSEELWLEFYQLALEHTIRDEDGKYGNMEAVCAAGVADRCLDEYDKRWGNEGSRKE